MLTKNYENLLVSVLESSSMARGGLPVVSVDGVTRFLCCTFDFFPYNRTASTTTSDSAAGISVGTGGTAASKDDVNLENTLSSNVALAISSTTTGCDSPGSRWLEYKITITNIGSEAITVRELGYKQTVKGSKIPEGTDSVSIVCLLDRTVLEEPMIIQAGDAGVIRYRLQTEPVKRTKNNVKLVSFTYGTDEDIATMIDAARDGLIDLQADAGWRVGDVRTIQMSAFTGGSVAHAAQDREIVISQFGDYNSCGCLFQFDFVNSLAETQRMNGTNTNVGGYGESEMYTTTLPAMVQALPSWLRTRLKTFSVLAGVGSGASTVESVPNNQLALRSEIEVYGSTAKSGTEEGSLVDRYRFPSTRAKTTERVAVNYSSWWLRSPSSSNTGQYCIEAITSAAGAGNATSKFGLSPFGCI